MESCVFWGCQIPAQLPFLEKTARALFSHLSLDWPDLANTTCCPEKLILEEEEPFRYVLVAARNLALAEKEGRNIVTLCNGCYATLCGTQRRVEADPGLRARVNERLGPMGLSIEGSIKVRHVVEALTSDIGVGKIKKLVRRPLMGLRVGVHYGCNMLRPQDLLQFDDPFQPESLDRLVEALGGTSVDYATKRNCCGGNFTLLESPGRSRDMLANKMKAARAGRAELMVVACPSCFMQLDARQERLSRDMGFAPVPVMHIVELLAFCLMGELDEAALKRHRVRLGAAFEEIEAREERIALLKDEIDVELLDKCAACGACDADCPVCQSDGDYSANAVVRLVAQGRIDEAVGQLAQWQCLDCLTCYEMCPNNFGMHTVFRLLRKRAIEQGASAETLSRARQEVATTGRMAQGSAALRKRLGLPEISTAPMEEIERLFPASFNEKEDE